jgi:hypothetical protein
MACMSWRRKIEIWRALDPERQARIRRARLALNVAESMAFAGEPVDVRMLTAELQQLSTSGALSRRGSER